VKLNYEMIAKTIIAVFSLLWIVAVLRAIFVVGFSLRMLQNPSFSLLLLCALVIPIAVVWGLYFYFNK